MAEFNDKVVIVTGGGMGIGRAICLGFAREGARVACADIDEDAGGKVVADGADLAGEIRFHKADVARNAECQGLVSAVASEWGPVDVLCNNVGIQPLASYVPAHELTEEQWDRIIDVNLKSYFLMTRLCVPGMIEHGGGVIVNTASVQGLQSALGVSAYAASKGGILSMNRQLALEYAKNNIRVLAVNPGTIDTNMVAESIEASGVDEAEMKELLGKAHPMNRIGRPEEIANVVVFLASDKASFMTGEYVCVDGGMMAIGAWAESETGGMTLGED